MTRFFDGMQIIDPGVVPLGQWHPGPPQHFDSPGPPTYCVVGRKPRSRPAPGYGTAEAWGVGAVV